MATVYKVEIVSNNVNYSPEDFKEIMKEYIGNSFNLRVTEVERE